MHAKLKKTEGRASHSAHPAALVQIQGLLPCYSKQQLIFEEQAAQPRQLLHPLTVIEVSVNKDSVGGTTRSRAAARHRKTGFSSVQHRADHRITRVSEHEAEMLRKQLPLLPACQPEHNLKLQLSGCFYTDVYGSFLHPDPGAKG